MQYNQLGPSPYSRIVAGLIVGIIFWASGYLIGDLLWGWAIQISHLNRPFIAARGGGAFEALLALAVALGVAIVGLPLLAIAAAIYYGTKFHVIGIVGFVLGYSPGLAGPLAGAVRRLAGAAGAVLTLPVGAALSLPKHRTWRARLIDLSTVLVFLAILAVGGLALQRTLLGPPDRIVEERPASVLTAHWSGSDSPNVRAYVQMVSITPERMAVTLRFENRTHDAMRFFLGTKIDADGARWGDALAHEKLASTIGDGRLPLVTSTHGARAGVYMPARSFLEGAYFFPRPHNPHSFWTVSFRWAEKSAKAPKVSAWTGYAGSASFDLREGMLTGPPFSISSVAVRPAMPLPVGLQ